MGFENHYHYFCATGKERAEAVALHYQRYQEVGFFTQNEQDPYELFSTYFGVSTLFDKKMVGVSRLIFKDVEELPTVKHFNIFDIEKRKIKLLERSKVVEMGAFTKLPQHDVSLGLIKICLQHSFQSGITHWICCLDERVYKYMHRIFKFPFNVIGETQVYLGSNTVPCLLNLSECIECLRQSRPAVYDYFEIYNEALQEVVK